MKSEPRGLHQSFPALSSWHSAVLITVTCTVSLCQSAASKAPTYRKKQVESTLLPAKLVLEGFPVARGRPSA
ncbi:MAG: hypothetical protein V4739_00865, partial [Pseudomonadota bacterium]